MKTVGTLVSIGLLDILGIIFVVLKLIGKINWSWWWVTLPFWGGLAFILALALIIFIVLLVAERH